MLTVPGELIDKKQLSTVYRLLKFMQNLNYMLLCVC